MMDKDVTYLNPEDFDQVVEELEKQPVHNPRLEKTLRTSLSQDFFKQLEMKVNPLTNKDLAIMVIKAMPCHCQPEAIVETCNRCKQLQELGVEDE